MSTLAPQATPFERFKARYVRREAWKDAEKAWKQVNGDAHEAEIHAALDWQIPIHRARERHHVPLPASWLRGERWTDEPPEVPAVVPTAAERERYRMWVGAVGTALREVPTLTEWVARQRGRVA